MPRIAGVNIPENKRIETSLTYIYGIGDALSRKILGELKIDTSKKSSDLTPKEVNDLKDYIEKTYKIEGDLRRQIMINVKRLKDIGA
ncbi:MAG: 30S ribosomal protein S13, partial [Candidatus Staskawiczbacteria bacterium]